MAPLVNLYANVQQTCSNKQQDQTGSYTKKASLLIANQNNFTSAIWCY